MARHSRKRGLPRPGFHRRVPLGQLTRSTCWHGSTARLRRSIAQSARKGDAKFPRWEPSARCCAPAGGRNSPRAGSRGKSQVARRRGRRVGISGLLRETAAFHATGAGNARDRFVAGLACKPCAMCSQSRRSEMASWSRRRTAPWSRLTLPDGNSSASSSLTSASQAGASPESPRQARSNPVATDVDARELAKLLGGWEHAAGE